MFQTKVLCNFRYKGFSRSPRNELKNLTFYHIAHRTYTHSKLHLELSPTFLLCFLHVIRNDGKTNFRCISLKYNLLAGLKKAVAFEAGIRQQSILNMTEEHVSKLFVQLWFSFTSGNDVLTNRN